jgi:hypothetical protein
MSLVRRFPTKRYTPARSKVQPVAAAKIDAARQMTAVPRPRKAAAPSRPGTRGRTAR